MNGVTFGAKHSIDDWELLMTSKSIGEAEPITNYVEIPGRSGALDFTEAYGEVKYKNRKIKFEFDIFKSPSYWWNLKQTISNYLNGQKLKVTLDQDPNYYYYSRLKVDDFSNDKNVAHIIISGEAEPYKYKQNKTSVTKTVSAGNTYSFSNDRKRVVPTLTLSSNMTISFEGTSYSLSAGTQVVPGIQFVEGTNTIGVTSGSGTIKAEYQEGSL